MKPHSRSHEPHRSYRQQGNRINTAAVLACWIQNTAAVVYPSNHDLYRFNYLNRNSGFVHHSRALSKSENPIPLKFTNNCPDTIWPGIMTQHGEGPESHGFELAPGKTKSMTVGPTWQGRCWGRTNCTTSGEDTAQCLTGDCFGKMECEYGGSLPVTLVEFNLAGGPTGRQCYYDISLVDGYNLPIGLVYIPAANTSELPPNFVNAACIGTAGYLAAPNRTGTYYSNSSYPMPWETAQTNADVADWCPWDLQAFQPTKPGDGVYPYPDDNVERPVFDPCKSLCAATNDPADCCTGKYDSAATCQSNEYSKAAKAVCPDAYSYAYDDQASTFIIPSGGGWDIVFCPAGRSTNILATFGDQLRQIAASGKITRKIQMTAMNVTYIESVPSAAARVVAAMGMLPLAKISALAVFVAAFLL